MYRRHSSIVMVTALGMPGLITAGSSGQCASIWIDSGSTVPGARSELPICYDEARGRLVLVGGGNTYGTATDMWEYDGMEWVEKLVTLPTHRSGHNIAYDSCRQRVVLFGGIDDSGVVLNDTWEWDGQTWTQVATGGPPGRAFFGMAFDAARGTVVIQGGDEWLPGQDADDPHLGDTWEWDGTAWSQIASTESPGARAYHKMAYDSHRQRVVLFGGQPAAYGGQLGDTWELGPTGWTLASTTGPSARTRFGMCFDPVTRRTVLFGGHVFSNTYFDDTWYWDGTAWVDAGIAGPDSRGSASLAFCGATGSVMLYGGNVQSNVMDDIWHLSRSPYDTNRDGIVNITELLGVLAAWGACEE